MARIATRFFRAVLASKATITAVVSTRIYDSVLPKNVVLPAISFWAEGGGESPDQDHALQERPIRVRCWAATILSAYDLYGIVRDALVAADTHSATVSAVTEVVTIWQEGGESVLTDTDSGDHSVVAAFGIALGA